MALNGCNSWEEQHNNVKNERNPSTPESNWSPTIAMKKNDMTAAGHQYLEHASPHLHTSFSDPYHVSPVASPETGRLMAPEDSSQQQIQHHQQVSMDYHWTAAPAPFLGYQTDFSTANQAWQTLQPPRTFETHGLPYDYDMMSYTGTWKNPMNTLEYQTQPTGSFSSTDSWASFGNPINQCLTVQDNSSWQPQTSNDLSIPDMAAHQYSLRPHLQLPCTDDNERDTSLEGTISPKMTRIIPSPSFQSAPPSPGHIFTRQGSASSNSSDQNQPMAQVRASRQSQGKHHQRTRVTSPKTAHQRTRLPSPKTSHRSSSSTTRSSNKTSTSSSSSSSRPIRSAHEQLPISLPVSNNGGTSFASMQNNNSCINGEDARSAKDEFLLKAKAKGMTYKEIRRQGGFSEAESTLRGRYRTLTKPKDLRVRKPEWSENDLRLLEKGVRRSIRRGQNLTTAKIPWREVAEYIFQSGGSYLFGLSTCRKRWDELVLAETGRGKDVARPFYEQ